MSPFSSLKRVIIRTGTDTRGGTGGHTIGGRYGVPVVMGIFSVWFEKLYPAWLAGGKGKREKVVPLWRCLCYTGFYGCLKFRLQETQCL